MRVIFHFRAGEWLAGRLAALNDEADLDVTVIAPDDHAGFKAALADTDVVWHVLEPLTAAHIAVAPNLKLVQKIGIGVNTIDIAAASARDIAVCNMPGTNSAAVAEMALALMLGCLRRIPLFHEATRAGKGWSLSIDIGEGCGEVRGRTVGLVGFGAVPSLLAPILTAMGARVIYSEVVEKPEVPYERVSVDTLLAEADIISLHVPLFPETEKMIDAAALAGMKPGAILINTARGELVDQPALVEALRSGRMPVAGLDVLNQEPVDPADPILTLDNVITTPHVSWLTGETLKRSIGVAVDNCDRLRDGRTFVHQVN
jgi:phosphoglycerate dehydrogenase-like enzyme